MKWKEILNSLTQINPATLLIKAATTMNKVTAAAEGGTTAGGGGKQTEAAAHKEPSKGTGEAAQAAPAASPDDQSQTTSHGLRLTPEGASSEKRLFDCCAFVIVCSKHQTMAVSQQQAGNSSICWLPFTVLPTDTSWEEGALLGSFIVLSAGAMDTFNWLKENKPYEEAYLFDVFRFQWPQTLEFTTRLAYYVKLKAPTSTKFACCQSTSRLQWTPLSVLTSGVVDKVWGPELLEFSRWTTAPGAQRIHEISLKQAFCYVPRDPPRNLEEAMLKTASVTEADVERLYADFVDHCFPSFGMTIWSFKEYMLKYGFENNDQRLVRLFHAFNYQRNGYLTFHELLLGLAAMEPNTVHGEARVKFLFRFYDRKNKGLLFENDFRKMISDIFPDLESKKTEFEAKVKEAAKAFTISEIGGKFGKFELMIYPKLVVVCHYSFDRPYCVGITYDEFFKVIGSQRFRGTSGLCRAQKLIFAHISRAVKQNMAANRSKQLDKVVTKKWYKGRRSQFKFTSNIYSFL